MIRNIISNITKCKQNRILINKYSKTALDIEKLEKDSTDLDVIDKEAKLKEQEIERKRNKSRLSTAHYNIIHGKVPYNRPQHYSHNTLRYNRKLYGKYGSESGVNVRICWPTKEELEDSIEYERVAHPHTVPEMIESARKEHQQKEEKMMQRQEDISKKLLKLDGWIKELNMKVAKKEAEAREAKERKERLIEEVRRHFGYTVDPKDDKFKEMLEKKEKEQKKAMKEARKKAKEEKLISKILTMKQEDKTENKINDNV